MLDKYLAKYKQLPIQIKASLWFLVCSFLQKGISVITTPIFTRIMSTSDYGNYSVFNSWLNIFAVFITLNLSLGVYNQGLIKYEDDRNAYSSSMQGLTICLVCVWTIICLACNKLFNEFFQLTSFEMILMILIIWTSAIFEFWAAEQRAEYKYRKLIIITLIVSVANPILSIFFMHYLKDKVIARILGTVVVALIAYVWMLLQQMHKGRKFYSKVYWLNALKFNIPLIPHYLSQIILSNSDRIMIERMIGSDVAGIYSLAYSVSLIMTLFNSALMQTISPWLYKKIKDGKIEKISKIAYPSLILIAIVNVALIACAPEAVAIFAPSSYYEAIWIIPPVAMSVFFMFAYDLFAKFEFYFEKTKLITIATMIGAIFNIVLNYIFIPKYGYYAAGYTTLICYIIYTLFHYIFMVKICKNKYKGKSPYNIRVLIKITIVFIVSGFVFMFLYNYMIIRYSIILVLVITLIIKRKKVMNFLNSILVVKEN